MFVHQSVYCVSLNVDFNCFLVGLSLSRRCLDMAVSDFYFSHLYIYRIGSQLIYETSFSNLYIYKIGSQLIKEISIFH